MSDLKDLKTISIEAEYNQIVEVLKKYNFNKSRTANALGINRKTLYNKIKAFTDLQKAS